MSTLNAAPEETKPKAEEQGTLIDTSKMNAGQRAALEMTEAARDEASDKGSFAAGLFMGRCDVGRMFPFPEQSALDRDQGDAVTLSPDSDVRRFPAGTALAMRKA